MNKLSSFIKSVNLLQCAPSENLEQVLEWVEKDEPITFFSWKMYKISLSQPQVTANPFFDCDEANKYIEKEKSFLKTLLDQKIRFKYIKLIPDELTQKFFGIKFNRKSKLFAKQVSQYFKRIYPKTQVVQVSKLLANNPELNSFYERIYQLGTKLNIPNIQFEKEVVFRSTYYTKAPLSINQSSKLARKAFGLFAAETAIIFKYFPNPVLLAGQRSVNIYKYEFFKFPADRLILPKLFVL